jgi:hypothetical protein
MAHIIRVHEPLRRSVGLERSEPFIAAFGSPESGDALARGLLG